MRPLTPATRQRLTGLALLAATLVYFIVLVTDGHRGMTHRAFSGLSEAANWLGPPGAILAGLSAITFGYAAHLVYCVLAVWGLVLIRHLSLDRAASRVLGLAVLVVSMAGLLHAIEPGTNPGGIVGTAVASALEPHFGRIGTQVISLGLVLIGILLATEFLFLRVFMLARDGVLFVGEGIVELREKSRSYADDRRERREAYALEADDDADAGYTYEADEEAPAPPVRRRMRRGNAARVAELVPPAEDAAPRVRDMSHIEIVTDTRRQQPVEAPEPDAPFGEVPDPEPVFAEAASAPAPLAIAQEAAALDTGDEAEEDTAPWDTEPEELPANGMPAGDPVIVDSAKVPEQLDLDAGADGPAFRPAKPKRRGIGLVRRTADADDEVPADYVYPKVYTKPPMDLLDEPEPSPHGDLTEKLLATSALLEQKLETFRIEAQVAAVTRGPTITRFELEPAPGIKVNRFIALADDLALALKAHRVRVEAPIPGKGRVGIEVPNKERDSVVLRELLESPVFRQGKGPLMVALGKTIDGETRVADLATMPHLLVAGATGSGKTVCVKTLLASLLFSKSPDELQLMLIDPKMVELSIFDNVPHLITPVVTDPRKASAALGWLINEMEERYKLFAHLRTRNIEVYNQSVENGEIALAEEEGGETQSVAAVRKLPYIVAVIDELADLMILARSEVENSIARLAQLARAVGIHLIIATQRPSVDVLTGVIKANFPARISFQVSSRVDSRCILDAIGAEKLIGMGDMLYLPAGQSKPARLQGAFVSDAEMESLIAYLKRQAPPQYRDEIQTFGQDKEKLEILQDEEDDLLEEAIRVVLDTDQASISMVQRKLRVGYTRAARLIDMMEARGIVGPHIGSKPREILVGPASNESGEVA